MLVLLPPWGRAMAVTAAYENLILSRLSSSDLELVEPHLERVDLPLRKLLERRARPIKAVYFPASGFASVVAGGDRPIEVGLIGREGMTGLPVVLGNDSNDHETFMQFAGHGHSIPVGRLRLALENSQTLQRVMLQYIHTFLNQTAQTAVANGRSKIEERLARWLLMADDRIDGGDLSLTHEFLAMMLGVRRPGVTVAIQELERGGLVARKRGHIVINDREGLENLCN
jgi:CRP-like cAMP-binding protein